MGGILTGPEIQAAIDRGEIEIDPFDPQRLNPASYDLTLGSKVAVYSAVTKCNKPAYNHHPDGFGIYPRDDQWLDTKVSNPITEHEIRDGEPFYLRPGIGYLMHTKERITTNKYVPVIDGKSSIGRLFAFCHVTAGYGDVGFDGQYTLEVTVIHPLLVYSGMRFCQMRFHTMVGDIESYRSKGNYQGKLAKGPVPSQSWKQFK